jgi:hypothetical protein
MPRNKQFDYEKLPNIDTFDEAGTREMVEVGGDAEMLTEFVKGLSSDSQYVEERIAMADIPDEDRYATVVQKHNDGRAPSIVKVDYIKLAYQHLSGMTMTQSAAYFRVSTSRISHTKQSAGFKAVLGMMTKASVETGRAFIAGAVARATGTLIHLLDSDNDKIKLMAANSILDRAGLLPPDQMVLIEKSAGVHGMSEDELLTIVHNAIKDVPRQIGGDT